MSTITQIQGKSERAFEGINTLEVEEIIKALIDISAFKSNIDKKLRVVCLKIIRKVIEQENTPETNPAFDWDGE